MGAFGNGIKLASIPNYALPLPCDPTFAFPIITMESKAYDITDSRAQNLHNASVMLRNLSVVANMETIKVFTVSRNDGNRNEGSLDHELRPARVSFCYYWNGLFNKPANLLAQGKKITRTNGPLCVQFICSDFEFSYR